MQEDFALALYALMTATPNLPDLCSNHGAVGMFLYMGVCTSLEAWGSLWSGCLQSSRCPSLPHWGQRGRVRVNSYLSNFSANAFLNLVLS